MKPMIAGLTCVLGVALVAAPSTPAKAAGDFIGGVAAGTIGTILGTKVYKKHKRRKYHKRRSRAGGQERSRASQEVADIQARLNALGFDAGVEDGLRGPRTRSAIRDFQTSLDQRRTGRLNETQINELYARSDALLTSAEPGDAAADPESVPTETPSTAGADATVVTPTSLETSPDQSEIAKNPFIQKAERVKTEKIPPLPEPKNPFDALETRPVIFGLTPGKNFTGIQGFLEREGYETCETSRNTVYCERETGIGGDKIAVAGLAVDGQLKIHTITRAFSFNAPVERQRVLERLEASYRPLLAAPGNEIVGTDECEAFLNSSLNPITGLINGSSEGDRFDADTQEFVRACPSYYAIDIGNGNAVSGFGITLYNGEDIVSALGLEIAPAPELSDKDLDKALQF